MACKLSAVAWWLKTIKSKNMNLNVPSLCSEALKIMPVQLNSF